MKVLKFFSRTCGPCKVLEKNLQDAHIEHESIDIQNPENVDLMEKYGVSTIPTIVILNDQQEFIKKTAGILPVERLKVFCDEAKG